MSPKLGQASQAIKQRDPSFQDCRFHEDCLSLVVESDKSNIHHFISVDDVVDAGRSLALAPSLALKKAP